jgi:hypothetical protein
VHEVDPDFLAHFTDPVERLLLTGQAQTVREAEEIVLNSSYETVLQLLSSPMTNEELANHPLLVLYRTRGSNPREDEIL